MPKRCLVRPRSACPAASALLIVARCHSPPGSRGAARRLGEARRPGRGRGVVLVVVAGAGQREASGHDQARPSWGIALQPCSAPMTRSAPPAPRSSSASRDRDRRHGRSAPGPPGCRGRAGSRPDILGHARTWSRQDDLIPDLVLVESPDEDALETGGCAPLLLASLRVAASRRRHARLSAKRQ